MDKTGGSLGQVSIVYLLIIVRQTKMTNHSLENYFLGQDYYECELKNDTVGHWYQSKLNECLR